MMRTLQNVVARLVIGTRRCYRIYRQFSAIQLHWLPARQRLQFKIAILVCQALSGNDTGYLTDDFCLVTNACPKINWCTLLVSWTRTTFGDGVFSAAGLRVWNCQSLDLKQLDLSMSCFIQSLNTFMFGLLYKSTVWFPYLTTLEISSCIFTY